MPRRTNRTTFRLEEHPFFWFGQIFSLRNRALNRELRPLGLDYQRMKVLAVLNEHSGCSMQDLAELTAVDRTSLTHTVQLLVTRGLLSRQSRETDRRSVVLLLTPAGRKLFGKVAPIILRQNVRSLAGVSAEDVRRLLLQLRRIVDNLRD